MIMSISFVCPYENEFSTTNQKKSSMFLQNILPIIENINDNCVAHLLGEEFTLVCGGVIVIAFDVEGLLAEVDHKAIRLLGQPKVGEKLIAEIGDNALCRLELHDDTVIADEIHLVMLGQSVVLILDGKMYLSLKRDSAIFQLEGQSLLIDGFLKAMLEFLMNLHGSADDSVKLFSWFHRF